MAEAKTHNPGHIPVPPAPQNPLDQSAMRAPASGSRQPCGPTLPPVLRTCQGHVSTLPNSEFLIMPNMMSPRCSGHTSGRLVARTAGEPGATGANPRWQRERGRQGWAPPAPPRRTARIGAGSGRSALAREGAGEPRSSSSRLPAEVLGAALVWGPEALGRRSSSAGPCLCPESGLFAEGLQTDCPLYRIWAAAVENFLPHPTHPYFCPRPRPLSGTWAPNSGISRFLEGCPGPPP